MFARKQHNEDKPHQHGPHGGHGGHGGGCCGGGSCGSGGGGAEPLAEGDPDATADLIDQITSERDEAIVNWKQAAADYQRALADYQNFQRRAANNETEAHRQGVTSVLGSILPVLDHFDLALSQKPTDDAGTKILEGVQVIRAELIRALENHGVKLIHPRPNDEFDPNRHSAIAQIAAEGVEPGRVSTTMQPGYMLGDRVIRSAKVGVAPKAE
ncbi:MAG: nucleotide exchange factor GrpE [Phycisphaeraceae bacterium]|nr:nucleotide exchange factor GrpE [Phycisphaeraceae bacterium]